MSPLSTSLLKPKPLGRFRDTDPEEGEGDDRPEPGTEDGEGSKGSDDSGGSAGFGSYGASPPRLCCYACAGRGKLWVVFGLDQPWARPWPHGRRVRCSACRGTGRMTIS